MGKKRPQQLEHGVIMRPPAPIEVVYKRAAKAPRVLEPPPAPPPKTPVAEASARTRVGGVTVETIDVEKYYASPVSEDMPCAVCGCVFGACSCFG